MKIAVLDLGTNTFHLLIADVRRDKSMTRVFKSKIMVKLGEGAIQKNYIAEIPFQRGIQALRHYAEVIRNHKPDKVFAFATSGIRSARNRKDFIEAAFKETSIRIKVIPGEKE